MRFLSALMNDMRYQLKYGFYFLYAFISAVYTAVLFVCPEDYKSMAASIIILTDPAMLGTFFIGGIWLLEKQEGLHGFWGISPLRPMEYILSKVVSLAIISVLSADIIALIVLRDMRSWLVLSVSVFIGSMVFTIIGLTVATYARSVNHYMLIASPPAILLLTPPILAAFGIAHPTLEILPGTALWRMICYSLDITDRPMVWQLIVLVLWLAAALYLAGKRVPLAMRAEGAEV